MSQYAGGCMCGAVRIEITAAPNRVGICHCLDCRKRQGAIFHTFAVFPIDAVTVTGETREFKTRSFCPTCGSPLFDNCGLRRRSIIAASPRGGNCSFFGLTVLCLGVRRTIAAA